LNPEELFIKDKQALRWRPKEERRDTKSSSTGGKTQGHLWPYCIGKQKKEASLGENKLRETSGNRGGSSHLYNASNNNRRKATVHDSSWGTGGGVPSPHEEGRKFHTLCGFESKSQTAIPGLKRIKKKKEKKKKGQSSNLNGE